ncbi:MAG: hypothetical protein KY447_10890 [Actinobacteria bacterium]|nr:hypothetical protein [Actinomycetota bacterium]MBW3643409.1 hypothetical protein [Actinomycetota bacterium]
MSYPEYPEERVVREERVVSGEPRRRRVVIERRGADGFGMNPIGAIIAAVLVVFILVLIFGYLL